MAEKSEKKEVKEKPVPAEKVEKAAPKAAPVVKKAPPVKKPVEAAKTVKETTKKEDKKGAKEPTEKKILRESVHTINLSGAHDHSRRKRARTCVSIIRAYLRKHTRKQEVLVSPELNEALWTRSIQGPPRKVKVKVVEEEGKATARLA